mgnify:CR=1 FL=1
MPTSFPSRHHDHCGCEARILDEARRLCRERGVRLTNQRFEVLEIVASSHKPLGAYDIMEKVHFDGRRQSPVIIYRALDFLIAQGLVHRLNSLNAFIACMHSETAHTAQFLICRNCRNVAELKSSRVAEQIDEDALKTGFMVDQQVVEISGICGECGKAS